MDPPTTEIYTLSLHDALPILTAQVACDSGLLFSCPNTAVVNYPATTTVTVKPLPDRKSTRLNSSHLGISYAVFCLKKKTNHPNQTYTTPRQAHRPPRAPTATP